MFRRSAKAKLEGNFARQKSETIGIPSWEHPGEGLKVPKRPKGTTSDSPINGSLNNPHGLTSRMRPEKMVVAFNREDSVCPSLGDITCDLSEANAFLASEAHHQRTSLLHTNQRQPVVVPQKSLTKSPYRSPRQRVRNPSGPPGGTHKSPKKNQLPHASKNSSRSPRSIPAAPKLDSLEVRLNASRRTRKSARDRVSQVPGSGDIAVHHETEISFQVPDISFHAPPEITKPMQSLKRIGRTVPEIDLGERSVDEGVVVPSNPSFSRVKKTSKSSGEGSNRKSTATKPPPLSLSNGSRKQGSRQRTAKARTDTSVTPSVIETTCLRPTGKRSVATYRASNTTDREIVLPGNIPKPSSRLPNRRTAEKEFTLSRSDLDNSFTTSEKTLDTDGRRRRSSSRAFNASDSFEVSISDIFDDHDTATIPLEESYKSNMSGSHNHSRASFARGASSNTLHSSADDSVSLALVEQEEEMIKLALERSLHDCGSYHSSQRSLSDQSDAYSFCGTMVSHQSRGSIHSGQPSYVRRTSNVMEMIDDDGEDPTDGGDIDMATAFAMSLMNESTACMSRFSTNDRQTFVVPERSLTNDPDNMSRYSSRANITTTDDTSNATDVLWKKDATTGCWNAVSPGEKDDQALTEEELLIEKAKDASLRDNRMFQRYAGHYTPPT